MTQISLIEAFIKQILKDLS